LRRVSLATVAVVAAAVIWWTAAPVSSGHAWTQIVLAIAITTGAMSMVQLALTTEVIRQPSSFSASDRAVYRLIGLIDMLPWAELMTVAVLVLEAQHRSRPWHTAVLAVALTGYLLAVHLTETETGTHAVRAQLPLLSAGVALTALSVGVAVLPGLPAGPGATGFRIGAAIVAVVAAGLVLPLWLGRKR
jgi:hypothetical protein